MKLIKVEGLCVDVEYLVMGMIDNNVYVISDGIGCMVVDPSSHAEEIMKVLDGRHLDAIVITHAHWDHMGAAAELRELTGAPVVASVQDAPYVEHPVEVGTSQLARPCPVDRTLSNGDVLKVGAMEWKAIETPGHSLGSLCLFCIPLFGNHKDGLPVLISGDTLFKGTTGRTDFEGGSEADMAASMRKLAKLPDDTVVLPGHNDLTTIKAERSTFARFGWEPEELS